jgi:transcriptional regulator with XRE-family HTH domain
MSLQWCWTMTMSFAKRMAAARKDKRLTQMQMSKASGINLPQIKRYESGHTQPSIEVLRRIALTLNVSTDALLFDKEERGPNDDLKMAFEAINQFDKEDKAMAHKVLNGLIIQSQTKRWLEAS